jgi:hypothetical protein
MDDLQERFDVRMEGSRPIRLTVAEMTPEDVRLAVQLWSGNSRVLQGRLGLLAVDPGISMTACQDDKGVRQHLPHVCHLKLHQLIQSSLERSPSRAAL